jgi:hypothetical protein
MKDAMDWQRLLQELLAEANPIALRSKADDLETALYFRGQELHANADGDAERKALHEAGHTLLKIRVEKLGFPLDPKILREDGTRQTQK